MTLLQRNKDYLLVFILLFFSGNPLSSFLFKKYEGVVALLLVSLLLLGRIKREDSFFTIYLRVMIALIILFLFQQTVLNYVSWLGAFNFLVKLFTGGLVIYYLKDRFSIIFFNILFLLSFISLILFIVINIFGISLPGLDIGGNQKSYIIYGLMLTSQRNQGMFWEAGAFAGILTLCLALNFNRLYFCWKNHRLKLLTIVIALLSTQSTSGYLVAFVMLLFYLVSIKKAFVLLFITPLLLIGGLYAYNTVPFLKNKIDEQYESAGEQSIGEVSNSRFGSIIFDWYYIKKHPLIGNGFSEKTRYADHKYLFTGIKEGEDAIGSGNSFSNYMASLGIFFIIGYFFLFYKAFAKKDILYSIVVLLVVLFNMQAEQWFNYSLYLGLIFVDFGTIKPSYRKQTLLAN